jgi:Kef-type K+ transport system membrane component KefB
MTDPQIQLFLFDLALIIILARLFGAAAKRIGQPPVIGEIVAGVLLGPTLFGGAITKALFPHSMIAPLTAIADVGLALFMFVVGYEVDLGLVRGREKVAGGVALGSIFLPLVLGIGLGLYFASTKHVHNHLTFVAFFGTAMSITAFPVLARILTDRGLHRTRIGGLALAAASVDDLLAWALLAVVVAIAGAKGNEVRLALVPVYAAFIIFVARPGLRWLADVYKRQGKLTPTVLATILALLLLTGYATDWMGIKFIFAAFILGIVMPREVPELREDILERFEQVSVILLLPVFFVIAGLSVNLSSLGLSGLADLGLIMLVAVVGKFGGAYYGARLTGVRRRQAGALASLMNTRGLTELVILTVGLQLHILDKTLYSLMVVMAIVTTAMAGPLLRVIYPNRIMERDIHEADRSALGRLGAHRVVVLVDDTATAAPLIDVAAQIARSRSNTDVVLAHLVAVAPGDRLEVGGGFGGELLHMTQVMGALHQLAARAEQRGVSVVVQSRFSDDVAAEMPGYIAAADPDTVVLHRGAAPLHELSVGGKAQLVVLIKPLPEAPTAAVARLAKGADSEAALQVAAQLALADGLDLVLAPPGRTATARVGDLGKRGIVARAGTEPVGSMLVAPADLALGAPVAAVAGAVATIAAVNGSDGAAETGSASDAAGNGSTALSDGDIHIAVVAGSNEASDDMDQWVEALDGHKQREGRQQ